MKKTSLFLLGLVLVLLGIGFLSYQTQCKMVREGHRGRRGRYGGRGRQYNQYYGGNYNGWGAWSPLLLYYYVYPEDDYVYVPVDDPYGLVPANPTYGPTPVYRYYPWM